MSDPEISGQSSLEETKSALEFELAGTKPGDPKFMAFSDQVDVLFAQADVNRARDIEERMATRVNQFIVWDRLDSRSSEIPGYHPSRRRMENLLADLASLFPEPEESLFENEYRQYLYRLRETIATRE